MIYTASTISALLSQVANPGDVCILTDKYRGGMFFLVSGTITTDGGITAPSATTGTYWNRLFQGEIEASWYGALPDGNVSGTGTVTGTDSGPYINAATKATEVYPANNLFATLKRKIKLNNGDYLINSPIYIRKGQHLQGEGFGATILVGGYSSLTEKTHILMGMKLEANNTTGAIDDPSNGLSPELSAFAFLGTQANRPIVYTNIQGCNIHDIWFLNVWQGIVCGKDAGDLFVHSCTWDQPSQESIIIGGFNILVSNCIFYRLVYGILIKGGGVENYIGTTDIQISNCKFEFNRQVGQLPGYEDRYAIKIGPGDRISNVLISNCIFTYYAPNPAQLSVIRINAHNVIGLKITNCMFNNWSGWAIADDNLEADRQPPFFFPTSYGTFIENCNFDGSPTSGQYIKAENPVGSGNNLSKGIVLKSGLYHIYNCTFRNIAGPKPIVLIGDKVITLYISAYIVNQGLIQNNNTNTGTQIISV